MKTQLVRVVKKLLKILSRTYESIRFGGISTVSYAQEGEDVVLKRMFSNQSEGFYVDVGAHHPMRFSNTYNFYKLGWTGINIEPNPESFNLFEKYRRKDINVNCGVARENGTLKYHMFDESALNTFDDAILKSRENNANCKYIKTIDIKVASLKDVLNDVMPPSKKIDFLTVDVEGLDLEVLQSNDWVKFRPKWVLVEQLNLADIESLDFEIHCYMKSLNYVLFAKTYNTLFYKEQVMS